MSVSSDEWRRLCGRLEHELDAALLDAPLDALDRTRLGAEAAELFAHCHAAGVAARLRDLVRWEAFAAWVEETCTEREGQRLAAALAGLLGASREVGPDDVARLVTVDAPPHAADALRAWAESHGIGHELPRPAREVLTLRREHSELTLFACLAGTESRDAWAALELAAQAERHLLREARRAAALPAREALWLEPVPTALRRLVERLRALLDGATPRTLAGLEFHAGRAVQVHADSGVCEGQLRADDPAEGPVEVKLYLAGYEQRGLDSSCRLCPRQPCRHTRALAGRLLDACFSSADRLHPVLLRFAARPSWEAFFAAVQPAAPPRASARERLAFVLRVAGEQLSVGVHQQSQQADGGFSAGRLIAPARALAGRAASDEDRALLELLTARSRTLGAGFVVADLSVLRALTEHARVLLEPARESLQLREEVPELRLHEQADGLRPELCLDGRPVPPGARGRHCGYLFQLEPEQGTLRFAVLTPALKRLLAALDLYRGILPRESYQTLAAYLGQLETQARIERPAALLGMERPTPRSFLLRLAPLPDEGIELSLSMRPFALSGLWPPGAGPQLVHGLEAGREVHVRRDLAWERDAAEQLLGELGLCEALRIEPYRYRVESTQAALALLTRAAQLAPRVDLEWAERAARLQLSAHIAAGDLKVALFKRGAFFFAEGEAQAGAVSLAFTRLLDAARLGERYVRIEGNDFAEIESALFERLRAAELCVLDAARLKLGTAALPFWLTQLGDMCAGGDSESAALVAAAEAEGLARDALELPEPLGAQLRAYQRDGVRFLLSRARFAPGALLADEMGLGKTIQSIALLVARAALGPAMVVCPTSLVDNWCAELARFAPGLTALRHRGAKRAEQLTRLGPGSVLVLSYELVARDQPRLAQHTFATQVLDEAQVIRNARTQRARAVASLEVGFRVALTGTPLENRLGDVWSLFQLLTPGLLGSWPRFRARFAVPIERYDNQERAAALRQLLGPLMLRRCKDQVAAELPQRTQVVQLVALSRAERALYRSALAEARRAIGKRKPSDPGRRLHVLAELTRLRQLACHPRLVLDDARVESSKLAALMSLLRDVLPRGHRVLVFSQFVRHLVLIQEALRAADIDSLWLSGSTPPAERAALVARFQAGAAPVFLISLKAGGTGLNLTSADYVVHMDPWWNPSAEDQASDRAHRIGQSRPVSIVKLVAQDTIEERVLLLHEHKRRLVAHVVGGAAAPVDSGEASEYEALLG